MLKPRVPNTDRTHEELFIQHYDQLIFWAMQLTENDRFQAKDLVQDAFVQFTFHRPELDSINNLEGYLRGILRHLHLSRVRRAARASQALRSAIDFEAADLVLCAVDARVQTHVHDELRAICHYACVRKESSIVGSVLILRFFHGYYPTEAARIVRTSRQVVDNSLRIARREAKAYLADPAALVFMVHAAPPVAERADFKGTPSDFFNDLQLTIFRSRKGACLSTQELHELYQPGRSDALETSLLAHIVSCEQCLEEVNKVLRLPPLSGRNPSDMLGPDTSAKGSLAEGPSKGAKMNAIEAGKYSKECRRRTRVIYEHRPEALEFSVNGFPLSSCIVDSERNEQTFTINIEEKINFVEVFGDHEIRLALFELEPPPDGPAMNNQSVELSDGRSLELSINFGSPWPSLHTVYRDPLLREARAIETDEVKSSAERTESSLSRLRRKLILSSGRVFRASAQPGFWLRPGVVTALFAVVALMALIVVHRRTGPPPIFATDLLSKATAAEENIAASSDQVVHRMISLEEKSAAGKLIARSKIEIWQSRQKGVTARRHYDQYGQLIAGDWRRADGIQTLYCHGKRPQLQLAPEKRVQNGPSLNFENVWQLSPSALEFGRLIPNGQAVQVEEQANSFVLRYEQSIPAGGQGLVRAKLILSKPDLHAIGQTLLVQQGSEQREYTFLETSYERRPNNAVAPSVFEPDPELLTIEAPKSGDTEKLTVSPVLPLSASPAVATAELEVRVLHLLNSVGADVDDQTLVSRTPNGALHVRGIVNTDQRKNEILRALAPVAKSPAVRLEIETVAEAMRRETQPQASPAPVINQQVEVTEARILAYEDLRQYFGKEDSQTDEKIKQFASRVLGRSSQAMSHAGTLKRIAGRFSVQDLRMLTPEVRAQWLAVVRSHARIVAQESRAVTQELQPIFFPSASVQEGHSEIEITDDASLYLAAERLFELVASNDRVISSAFAISNARSANSTIKTPQFWRSLRAAEALAKEIGNAQ